MLYGCVKSSEDALKRLRANVLAFIIHRSKTCAKPNLNAELISKPGDPARTKYCSLNRAINPVNNDIVQGITKYSGLGRAHGSTTYAGDAPCGHLAYAVPTGGQILLLAESGHRHLKGGSLRHVPTYL